MVLGDEGAEDDFSLPVEYFLSSDQETFFFQIPTRKIFFQYERDGRHNSSLRSLTLLTLSPSIGCSSCRKGFVRDQSLLYLPRIEAGDYLWISTIILIEIQQNC